MNSQPEHLLELNLIDQLIGMGYERVVLKDENDLVANLKTQIQKQNNVVLDDKEFGQVLTYINKGTIFDRAKLLRSRIPYVNSLGENKTIQLLDTKNWCKNQFQVANQITIKGNYKNRYDVSILLNGIPVVQIELKKRGLELKEAFNQINRYQRHSFGSGLGLFGFLQLFVISNGVNTKYYCNGRVEDRNFEQTFYWANKNNDLITNLSEFAAEFLSPCHLSKMITQYIVLNESQRALMVLRPYQYYAVEAIINQVQTTTDYGYIWHTTGSGKTLTSFKASQILTSLPEVHKVVFVVDRKDLDTQTAKEFNSFAKGSIDATNDTKTLVQQMKGNNKLIVTTIQKLNNTITKSHYLKDMEALKDKRIVFIFDECHRSQFGLTHESIKKFFVKCQMFGFTGTPIFPENAGTNEYGKRTTEMLFGKPLHKYTITDAIRDGNVLRFAIEYISTFKQKDTIQDIEIEKIDEAEVMDSPIRREAIVKHIIQNHNNKTSNKKYTAIFCVSSTDSAIAYYKLFRKMKNEGLHDLRVATIFTYASNEEQKLNTDNNSILDDDTAVFDVENSDNIFEKYKREELDDFITDYNEMFRSNYSTKDSKLFYDYYNDIATRVKNKEIDILLVVNMFLTGFDSKSLNTLYVDKNLKYHGLIQAYSRTNRILDKSKPHGNIVCYRNLKSYTDEAIVLFANKDAISEISEPPYEDLYDKLNTNYGKLIDLTPNVDSVNLLVREDDIAKFIKVFREIIRLISRMKQYGDFSFDDLPIAHQEFEDYKSKYLDLYEEYKGFGKKDSDKGESIIDDLDFELELIHKDEINVSYILNLLVNLNTTSIASEKQKQINMISDLLNGDIKLRSKKELIENFIKNQMPLLDSNSDIKEEFEAYVDTQRKEAFINFSKEEQLNEVMLEQIIGEYLFTNKQPLREDIVSVMNVKPSLKERSSTIERISNRIYNFVDTYISGFTTRF